MGIDAESREIKPQTIMSDVANKTLEWLFKEQYLGVPQQIIDLINNGHHDDVNVAKALHIASEGRCLQASTNAAYLLEKEHKDEFKHIFILRIMHDEINGDYYHTFVITQDHNDQWYASSPACYKTDPKLNKAQIIFQNENLEELLNELSLRYQTPIPGADSVLAILSNHPEVNTISEHEFTCLRITHFDLEGLDRYTQAWEQTMSIHESKKHLTNLNLVLEWPIIGQAY